MNFYERKRFYSELLKRIADPSRSNDIALINEKGHRIKYEELNKASNYLAKSIKNKHNWTSESSNNHYSNITYSNNNSIITYSN